MRLCLQYRPYTIGVFEFDKAEASRLICSFVLHDDTIYHFPILWEVVSQCLWENKEMTTVLIHKNKRKTIKQYCKCEIITEDITQPTLLPEHKEE